MSETATLDKEKDVSQKAPESEAPKDPHADGKAGYLPEDTYCAMMILVNAKDGSVGLTGVPVVMNDPTTAYGVLKRAEKQLDLFFAKKGVYSQQLHENMKTAENKFGFRNFVRNFGRR